MAYMYIRDRLFITSQGRGAVVLGGGTILKQAPFGGGGGKFFTYEKREGGQILWHSNSSLLNRFYNWNQKKEKFSRFLLFTDNI